MHEMSLIANLLKKIEILASEQNAKKVCGVKIKLGALSHISSEHFREHFEAETKGTLADGAKLYIDSLKDIDDPNAQEIILESIDVECR